MDLSPLKAGIKNVGEVIVQNSTTILTGLSVAGVITTLGLGIRGTIKAVRLLDEEEYKRRRDWSVQTGEDASAYPIHPVFSKKEVIQLTWKCYIPTALMTITTISCIVGAHSVHTRRNAALASMYSLTETTLKEYQKKVEETIGEKKEQKIREAIAQDKLDANPVSKNTIIVTGGGDTLFFDELSGRYFKSSIEKIGQLRNDFNKEVLIEGYKTLNEWYVDLGLEEVELGRASGWHIDHGYMELDFHAKLAENQACIVIEYVNPPRPLGN